MLDNLIDKLHNKKYITLETTPGHSPNFQNTIDKIKNLGLDLKVDGFSTTDNPLAKLKYNSILAAIKLQNSLNKPVIATMSMRDRNKLALQSDLLGANEFDIRAILALTGDSAKMSDQPSLKGVFEGNSTLLLDIIKCFNSGIDFAGKPLKEKPKPIYGFSVIDAYAKNPKTIYKKMLKKIEHGTLGIITQPIYDIQTLEFLLEMLEKAKQEVNKQSKTQLISGFFPIVKLRTAQFLYSHVPGINVPTLWLDKLHIASGIGLEEEKKVGFDLSKKLYEKMLDKHNKIHIMTANQFELASDILE
jgi:5,10-methylenetetrahydrofolate reductase